MYESVIHMARRKSCAAGQSREEAREKKPVHRRLLPVTFTLRPEQIEHIDMVSNRDRGDRSRWLRDAVDRKIYDENRALGALGPVYADQVQARLRAAEDLAEE